MTRPTPPLDADDALRLLTPRRRRATLRALLEQPDRPVDVATLATRVRCRCALDRVEGTRNEIQLSLHHVDLPKLDAAGVVDYDPADGRVRYTGGDSVEALLETLSAQFE